VLEPEIDSKGRRSKSGSKRRAGAAGKGRATTRDAGRGGATETARPIGAGATTPAMAGAVRCDIAHGVATLTLDRAEARNALTAAMIEALHDALDRIEADASIRLVILRGQGEHFCAGADIKALLAAVERGAPEEADHFLAREYLLDLRLQRLRVPLVTIADGITMGGGLGLAFGGRIVATERSRFAMPEARIGFLTDVGATHEMARRLGRPLARYFAWTAESFDGAQALRWGFADELIASADLEAFVARLKKQGVPASWTRPEEGAARHAAAPDDDAGRHHIETHFALPTRSAVLRSLRQAAERGADAEERGWASRVLALLETRSPVTLWASDLLLGLDYEEMARRLGAAAEKGPRLTPDGEGSLEWIGYLRDALQRAEVEVGALADLERPQPRALALACEFLFGTAIFRLPDFAAGVGAFRDKHQPDFPSRQEPLGIHRALFQTRPGWELLRHAARLARDPFWLDVAHGELDWITPPRQGYDGSTFPCVRWFADGTLNASVEALDRWVERGRGDRTAFLWEGDRIDAERRPLEQASITYADLLEQVKRCAAALRALGLRRGDSLVLYMPNIIETYVVQLAAARVGVVYHPVFAGFAREELSDRLHLMGTRVLMTVDGAFRKGEVVQYKRDFVDPALADFVPVERALDLAAEILSTHDHGKSGAVLKSLRAVLADKVTAEKKKLRALLARALAEARSDAAGEAAADGGATASGGTGRRPAGALETLVLGGAAQRPLAERIEEAARLIDAQELRDEAEPDEEEGLTAEEKETVRRYAARLEEIGSAVEKVVVLRRIGTRDASVWVEGRDIAFSDFLERNGKAGAVSCGSEPEPMQAEDPLFVMFTSGSTGKPKGLVHTHGGYLARLPFLLRTLFGLSSDQRLLTVADPGWITGQSFVCWGPLLHGMTSFLIGFVPTEDRLWAAVERYGIHFLKTGVTGIRASMGDDPEHIRAHDLSSLRQAAGRGGRYTSCSCAEPLDAAVQAWWETHIGPMMNCYWRTEDSAPETGAAPEAHPQAPDASARPLPWADLRVYVIRDDEGNKIAARPAALGEKGTVFVRNNPGIARGTWARPQEGGSFRTDPRFRAIYHADVPGWHNSGDAAVANPNGALTFLGRDDEVLNVSGHRVGTQEIEGAVRSHPAVANLAAIGIPAEIKGDNPVLFVKLRPGHEATGLLDNQLRDAVAEAKGSHVAPAADFIFYVQSLPTTKSGKILRRFLKYAAALDRDTLASILTRLKDERLRAGLIKAESETLQTLFPTLQRQGRTLRLGSVATVDQMAVLIDVLKAVARRRDLAIGAELEPAAPAGGAAAARHGTEGGTEGGAAPGTAAGTAANTSDAAAAYRPYEAAPEATYALGRTDFRPGLDPLPPAQQAWAMTRDAFGRPLHGDPDRALQRITVPVPRDPEPNEVIVQNLYGGSTHNVLHALLADPVSPFEWHRRPYHILGSGAVGRVVACGREVERQGLLTPGQAVINFPATYRLLDARVNEDGMHAGFEIQGFETPQGTLRPFDRLQATQCLPLPKGLTLEQAASFMLNLVTVYRALTHRMPLRRGQSLLVEGATGGTGSHALEIGRVLGARVIGMVGSAARGARALQLGATAWLDRNDPEIKNVWTPVPDDPGAWGAWERAGEPLLRRLEERNDGRLADTVLSFTGRPAFGRLVQMLSEGGRLAFFGAFMGYTQRFLGQGPQDGGIRLEPAERTFERAGLRPGMGVLVHYGAAAGGDDDPAGLQAIRQAAACGARVVALTHSDAQSAWLNRGAAGAAGLAGTVSLESLRRGARFEWPERMPDYDADPARYEHYETFTLKPLASAVGRLLRHPGELRGQPDLVYARGAEDTLAADLFMVKPFTGRVVYGEAVRRAYTMFAPQVWMRQRRVQFPGFEIIGSHMGNPQQGREVIDWIAQGLIRVPPPRVYEADEAPAAFQAMHDNTASGSFVVHLTSPARGVSTVRELDEANGATFIDEKYVTVRIDAPRGAPAGAAPAAPAGRGSATGATQVARVTLRGEGGRPPTLARDAIYQIGDAFRKLRDDARVGVVILTGEGSVAFLAGQDLRQLYDDVQDIEAAETIARDAQRIFDDIEAFPRPVIAVLNGVALGGGHELFTCAHYRLAVRSERVRVGQPEIDLGIIPGFAGTQRLTRLLIDRLGYERGVREALEMILGGRHYEVDEARALGLLDETVERDALQRAYALAWEETRGGGGGRLRAARDVRRRARERWSAPQPPPRGFLDDDARLRLLLRQAMDAGTGRGVPAVRAVEAMLHGLTHGFEEGCRREARLFASLVVDERYGRKGIRRFLDRQEPPPLPPRRTEILMEGGGT
jgi:acyl-coenzyme A synthetase/AMP-(fatty) acid ligase/enoyl-CoA hydratase/carnithine racemase/NADPH:quinone reductase-like Zn-dependent oxidoreductase